MNPEPPSEMAADLRNSVSLHREILALVEQENQTFRRSENPFDGDLREQKKRLLSRLGDSLAKLKRHRLNWQSLGPEERARFPEIPPLLRQNQELIMKIITLDRENEQNLLRRGLVPANCLPSAHRQRPNYVAGVYKRHGSSS
jgi:hypothetical protein